MMMRLLLSASRVRLNRFTSAGFQCLQSSGNFSLSTDSRKVFALLTRQNVDAAKNFRVAATESVAKVCCDPEDDHDDDKNTIRDGGDD